jgi:GntR family transcriptional regulator
LAAVLGVNANTVLRALRIVREEGSLDFRRGRDVTMAGTVHEGAAIEMVRELPDFARLHGYQSEDVVEIVRSLL